MGRYDVRPMDEISGTLRGYLDKRFVGNNYCIEITKGKDDAILQVRTSGENWLGRLVCSPKLSVRIATMSHGGYVAGSARFEINDKDLIEPSHLNEIINGTYAARQAQRDGEAHSRSKLTLLSNQ